MTFNEFLALIIFKLQLQIIQNKMGAEQSFCSNQMNKLQIPTTVEQGLQINLKSYKQHAPNRSYARRSSIYPNLSQRVQQTIKYLLQTEPLKLEINEGFQFPCFLILKKNVYYVGQWLNGLPHGKGRVYFINGCFFEGFFNMGEAQGTDNIFIYSDGSFYRGSFVNSKKNGFGKFYYHNGFQYEGNWKDGKPHGINSIQRYPDKSIFTGSFVNGIKQGKGQYFWADGKQYLGQFKNGYMQGQGMLKKGKNSFYQGRFKQNQKSGKGFMKTAYGTYEGEFKKGLMSGQAIFKWNDGRVYKGNFLNGKMNGHGELSFANGKKIIGEWINGQNMEVHQINSNKKQ